MKRRRLAGLTVGLLFSVLFAGSAYAGEWEQDFYGWWYQNEDGTYPVNSWQWIDGNNDGVAECYYFDENGYCMLDTLTPDGYYVDKNGAWIIGQVIQTKSVVQEKRFTKEQAAEIVIENTYMPGYCSVELDTPDDVLIIWQSYPSGFKGKYTVDMNTGDCWLESPFWSPDMPLDGHLTRTYVLNVKSYL